MRIILVNKFHYLKGGAETYYLTLGERLKAMGHEVAYFSMRHPDNLPCAQERYFVTRREYNDVQNPLRAARDGFALVYSIEAKRSFETLCEDFRPDVVHLNNVHRQITLSILDAPYLSEHQVPVVYTAHDYVTVCPSYLMLDGDGRVCDECLQDGRYRHCITRRCVKGSRAKSALAALEASFNRAHRSNDRIDVAIAPSKFMAGKLVEGGWPTVKVRHMQNFVSDDVFARAGEGSADATDWDSPYVLFFGRLSKEKGDPEWMREFRLKSLETYNEMPLPNWGPSIEGLDMDHIATYVRPKTDMKNDWKDVPQDIKDTFERLGIPQAERKSLAGVGAQYDSELVYHNVKSEVAEQGVIYTDMESALKGEYAEMVHEYFMKLVTPRDHKFAALHGAVWSGGSFVYVPKGVQVSIPLQSYFRLNAKGAGQFEHTLIIVDEGASLHFIEGCSAPKYNVANLHAGCVELYVKKNAKLRYSTIENWSKNMYNLNTKRALVEENGVIEWVSGSFGSHVGCLYPMSVLKGDNSRMEFTGVTFAGAGQNLDTGAKVTHIGRNTSSYMNTRSISKSGGISTFRSSVVVAKTAKGAKSSVSCQSLMLDSESRSDTVPAMDIRTRDASVGHEAKIGSISNDAIFYLMSRGMSEEDARAMIVSGFADNVSKELPVEYAVEMNNLIRLEMKGSIG